MSPQSIIAICWAAFILYWAVSALHVKKDVKASSWRPEIWSRILFVIVIFIILKFTPLNFPDLWLSQTTYTASTVIGILCVVAGIAFAVWARVHLGRNWSPHPAMKQGHELVTSGPYAYVRHPIYTGIILALFGSALASGLFWYIFFVFLSGIFLLRIGKEEQYMMQLFPNEYPAYKARTKILIPFIY